jgi:hypothetical protein
MFLPLSPNQGLGEKSLDGAHRLQNVTGTQQPREKSCVDVACWLECN